MTFRASKNNGRMIGDINVTPLVDVALVLLVVFMITAPLLLSGIDLNLPKTKDVSRVKMENRQVILSVNEKKDFYLGKEKIEASTLVRSIKNSLKINKTETLYLRADEKLLYGDVAQVMGQLKSAGITRIALITEIESKNKK